MRNSYISRATCSKLDVVVYNLGDTRKLENGIEHFPPCLEEGLLLLSMGYLSA